MRMKVRKQMKFRHQNNAGRCKIGLEVDFKDGLGCNMRQRTRRHGGHVIIIIIIIVV